MLTLPLLFWLALAVPGLAIICRADGRQLHSGLLPTLSLAYLATFALLSPVAIIGYIVRAPLAVLSTAIVLAVFVGLIQIIRLGHWRILAQLALAAFGIELVIVLGDVYLGFRVGSIMLADATTHLARIRLLVDHGLTNSDPFIAGDYFYPLYHTNLLHALCAACSQLTGVDHLGVWFTGLAWAKLVIAGAAGYLAWATFRKPWPTWMAVLFVVAAQAPVPFMIYPNKLAPFWLLTLLVGLLLRMRAAPDRKGVLWIAAASLVIGQIHALYVGFALVLLTPLLISGSLERLWHGRRRSAAYLACAVVALAPGLPFALVSKSMRAHAPASVSKPGTPERDSHHFLRADDGRFLKHPLRGFGGGRGWRYWWLAAGVTVGLLGSRRREVGGLLAVATLAATIFFVPALCTQAAGFLGAKWILLRMEVIFTILFPVLVPAAFAAAIMRWRPRYWQCAILGVLVFVGSVRNGSHASPYDWDRYRSLASLSQARRHGNVSKLRQLERFLSEHLPAGETVLTDPSLGMRLVSVYDCRLIAVKSGSVGVPIMIRRREDVALMFKAGDPELAALREKYPFEYIFAQGRRPAWAKDEFNLIGRNPHGALYGREGSHRWSEEGGSPRE